MLQSHFDKLISNIVIDAKRHGLEVNPQEVTIVIQNTLEVLGMTVSEDTEKLVVVDLNDQVGKLVNAGVITNGATTGIATVAVFDNRHQEIYKLKYTKS